MFDLLSYIRDKKLRQRLQLEYDLINRSRAEIYQNINVAGNASVQITKSREHWNSRATLPGLVRPWQGKTMLFGMDKLIFA